MEHKTYSSYTKYDILIILICIISLQFSNLSYSKYQYSILWIEYNTDCYYKATEDLWNPFSNYLNDEKN